MEEEKTQKRRFSKELMEWVRALVIALLAAIFITQVIIVNAQVPTESMVPTIQAGDRVIGFRLAYLFDPPQRGDIVIFRYPDDESQYYVKRVIGLPGETVRVAAGKVYIDGSDTALDDSYINETMTGDFGPFEVPQNHYFVMGDNRNRSWDSRYWQNTYVSDEQLVGKAIFRLFPKPGPLR
ncbi:signal peptidase I [Ruminococcaceae bacterium OttesenSCG-928-I18]|nr:signal peptidase I [Ruminococcaceae bacterium OttesenSCG-928-I18]